jgi:hypothetical protein
MTTSVLRRTGLILTVAIAALSAYAAAPVKGPIGTSTADAACRNATIGGQRKCIGRGQFCAVRNQSDYRRNGFRCAWDGKGRYRLR